MVITEVINARNKGMLQDATVMEVIKDKADLSAAFEVDVTMLTSEMLGRMILTKIPTSKVVIIPVED